MLDPTALAGLASSMGGGSTEVNQNVSNTSTSNSVLNLVNNLGGHTTGDGVTTKQESSAVGSLGRSKDGENMHSRLSPTSGFGLSGLSLGAKTTSMADSTQNASIVASVIAIIIAIFAGGLYFFKK